MKKGEQILTTKRLTLVAENEGSCFIFVVIYDKETNNKIGTCKLKENGIEFFRFDVDTEMTGEYEQEIRKQEDRMKAYFKQNFRSDIKR